MQVNATLAHNINPKDAAKTGLVADIQRSSVHDGPGLRTTVFLKGCQLSCAWCHNPETISPKAETLFYPEKCISCGGCHDVCYAGAKVPCGRSMAVGKVMEEVLQDAPYYGDDGGLTISGGEPLCQVGFTMALIGAAKACGIHTALETNLCLPTNVVRPALAGIDLLMADMKTWDEALHQRWTGAKNALAKQNFVMASQMGLPIILRTPLVPGVNDSPAEIGEIARFAAGLKTLLYYEILTYHPLGLSKSQALGIETAQFEKPTRRAVNTLATLAAGAGIAVRVNNVPFIA